MCKGKLGGASCTHPYLCSHCRKYTCSSLPHSAEADNEHICPKNRTVEFPERVFKGALCRELCVFYKQSLVLQQIAASDSLAGAELLYLLRNAAAEENGTALNKLSNLRKPRCRVIRRAIKEYSVKRAGNGQYYRISVSCGGFDIVRSAVKCDNSLTVFLQ